MMHTKIGSQYYAVMHRSGCTYIYLFILQSSAQSVHIVLSAIFHIYAPLECLCEHTIPGHCVGATQKLGV